MPFYMFQARYTAAAIKAMVDNPQDREAAARPLTHTSPFVILSPLISPKINISHLYILSEELFQSNGRLYLKRVKHRHSSAFSSTGSYYC